MSRRGLGFDAVWRAQVECPMTIFRHFLADRNDVNRICYGLLLADPEESGGFVSQGTVEGLICGWQSYEALVIPD
jgi:hypothetical protein